MYFLLQLFRNAVPSLWGGVGAVKDGHLVSLDVDVANQVIQTHLGAHFADLVALLVVEVEKVTLDLDAVVWIEVELPIMYFLR